MSVRTVQLTDHLDDFVDGSVSSGRYQDASEVVREGLRLLQQRHAEDALRLDLLRDAVRVGEDTVAGGDFDDVAPEALGNYLAALGSTRKAPPPA